MKKKLFTCLILLMVAALAVAGKNNALGAQASTNQQANNDESVAEAHAFQLPGEFDRAAYGEEQAELHKWLSSEKVESSARGTSGIVVQPTQEDLNRIAEYHESEFRTVMVGVNLPARVDVTFGNMGSASGTRAFAGGAVTMTASGNFTWTTRVEAVGATAVRVHFTGFNLPADAELYLFSDSGEVKGPFANSGPNQNGDFWATVSGSVAYVQVMQFGETSARSLSQARFEIEEVAYLGENFLVPRFESGVHQRAFCSYNAQCVVDAACHTGVSQVTSARKAVAHYVFSKSGGQYICSGGLITDQAGSGTPYFLTANHCVNTSSQVNSMDFYWQYATSSCGASCFSPYSGAVPNTTGASLLSTSATGDYTLARCSQTPPAGSVFLGWTTAAVANSNGTNLYRISHPKGAPQAYSRHQVDTSAGTCGSWPRGSWIYSDDVTGATEGGSSGSPVLNSSAQIVGQLSGACGPNPQNSCDSRNATVDGAFASYFNNISSYLTGGGGSCSPSGTACTNNSECCSGSCTGWFSKSCN